EFNPEFCPPNGRIRFELTEAHYKCDPVCEEYVEVKHKLDLQISGFRSCCLPVIGEFISEAQSTISSKLLTASQTITYQMKSNFNQQCQCAMKRITFIICEYRQFHNCKYIIKNVSCNQFPLNSTEIMLHKYKIIRKIL
ncbi:hypothetical protein WUBG_06873, partial [Wuchereria bancrofti]